MHCPMVTLSVKRIGPDVPHAAAAYACACAWLQEYLGDAVLHDEVYLALIERASLEPVKYVPPMLILCGSPLAPAEALMSMTRDTFRSPVVISRCATLLKRFMLRCVPLSLSHCGI